MPYSDSISNYCKLGLDKCFKCSVIGELTASRYEVRNAQCSSVAGMPVRDKSIEMLV